MTSDWSADSLARVKGREEAVKEIENVWWDVPGLAADACLAVALHVLKDPEGWRERLGMTEPTKSATLESLVAELPQLERLEGDWDD